ncbi:helicase associated domain-containing protein, partial [Gemmatimonadota bacterium]
GFRLGIWVNNRRNDHRKGNLSSERVEALEAVPGWSWDAREDLFWEGLERLMAFQSREGHSRVTRSHVEDGLELGGWVTGQRTEYRKGKLSPERVAALEAVPGWIWDAREDFFWKGLKKLTQFCSQEGHAMVPAKHVEPDGFTLGSWVSVRRAEYRQGKLSPGRVAALEALPGWLWDPRKDLFWKGLEKVTEFRSREGHARVLQGHVESDGFKLGMWVHNRRQDHRKGKLSSEQVAVLEAVPGWSWDPYEDDFREGLEKLREFCSREGHARVPQGRVESDGFKLGPWVQERRTEYRQGKLSSERVAALDAVPSWSWDPFEGAFREGLEKLMAFQCREGHARVTRSHVEDGFKLGGWVSKRRAEYRKGNLSSERLAALEAIKGWTW